MGVIPKIAHFIWFGPKTGLFGDADLANIIKFASIHERWAVKLWNMEAVKTNQAIYEPWTDTGIHLWWLLSDFYRLKILFIEGGMYMDTDIETLGLIDGHLVHGLLNTARLTFLRNVPNNCLVACEPGNEVVGWILDQYRKGIPVLSAKEQLLSKNHIAGPSRLTVAMISHRKSMHMIPSEVVWDHNTTDRSADSPVMIHRSHLRWQRDPTQVIEPGFESV